MAFPSKFSAGSSTNSTSGAHNISLASACPRILLLSGTLYLPCRPARVTQRFTLCGLFCSTHWMTAVFARVWVPHTVLVLVLVRAQHWSPVAVYSSKLRSLRQRY